KFAVCKFRSFTASLFCCCIFIMSRRKNSSADVYFRFLQLTRAVRGLPCLPALDPLEERLLEVVACAQQQQEQLCVRDMMNLSELGSPAMLHKRLHSLRKKGWVFLAGTEDARRKQVELTPEALSYFDKLSRCMVKATAKR